MRIRIRRRRINHKRRNIYNEYNNKNNSEAKMRSANRIMMRAREREKMTWFLR